MRAAGCGMRRGRGRWLIPHPSSHISRAPPTVPVPSVEALGADTLIHIAVAGRTVIARLPHGAPAEIGEPIALAAARDRVYVFDAETGARVAA